VKPDTPIHISAENPSHILTVSRARLLTEATAATLRKHFSIGAAGPNRDVVSVISTGHHLLPLLPYAVIAASGVFSAASSASTPKELSTQIKEAGSKVLCCVEGTKDVAVQAAEMAGWGESGGGRVLVMGEGETWGLKAVVKGGGLGKELVDEDDRLQWERITDPVALDESIVVLIYSSGTTGLPKGVCSCFLVLLLFWYSQMSLWGNIETWLDLGSYFRRR
jgi:long-subunit acyl-CoA synthetase (AMP-forming)